MSDRNSGRDDSYRLNRRHALAVLGTGVGAVAGIGAFSGTAAAWKSFDVCFDGCSEVWMVVTEHDISYDPPAVVRVIVESDGEAVCREIEFTDENATSIPELYDEDPDRFDEDEDSFIIDLDALDEDGDISDGGEDSLDEPFVVTYAPDDEDEKILGVVQYDYGTGEPVWCVHRNENDCATTPDTPSVYDASCVPDDHPICPNSEICAGFEADDNEDGDDTGEDSDGIDAGADSTGEEGNSGGLFV